MFFCCCIRIRVPRTKQEIEADYKRKEITGKFRKRLKFISNQDMEAINLQKGKNVGKKYQCLKKCLFLNLDLQNIVLIYYSIRNNYSGRLQKLPEHGSAHGCKISRT